MKIERAKVKAIIRNKLDGEKYIITERSGDTAIAQIIEKEDPIVLGIKNVRITEDNAICFRVLKDADPEIPEGFYLDNGYLKKDGKLVTEQGSLKFDRILYSSWPGLLLLSVKEKEGIFGIYSYHLGKDLFTALGLTPSNPQLAELENGEIVLYYSRTEKRKIDDEEKEFLISSGVIFLKNGIVKYDSFNQKFKCLLENPIVCKDTIFFNSTKSADDTSELVDNKMVWAVNEHDCVPINMECLKRVTYDYVSKGYLLYDGKELIHRILKYEDHCHNFQIPVPDGLDEKYCYLVDITTTYEHMLITLASDEYEIVKLSVKDTSDRGKIVTLL